MSSGSDAVVTHAPSTAGKQRGYDGGRVSHMSISRRVTISSPVSLMRTWCLQSDKDGFQSWHLNTPRSYLCGTGLYRRQVVANRRLLNMRFHDIVCVPTHTTCQSMSHRSLAMTSPLVSASTPTTTIDRSTALSPDQCLNIDSLSASIFLSRFAEDQMRRHRPSAQRERPVI